MRPIKLKSKLTFTPVFLTGLNFFLIIFVFNSIFITPLIAQDSTGKLEGPRITNEAKDGIRVVITTSGPAKFNSRWSDNPPRLVVEFQTRNIVSKIDNEVMVNLGVIKRITSEYVREGKNKSLKSLTFELTQKAPYKIWQEADTVILDIQTPQEISVFPEEGKEIFVKNETKDVIIKRLEAMDAALAKVSTSRPPSEAPKVITGISDLRRKSMPNIIFWFVGLSLISGLGLLLWLLWRRYRLILDKNMAIQEIARLKSQLQEQNKLLEHEETLRKAIENASLVKEKELEQLKQELERETKLLEQEEKLRKTKEEELLQKEKEHEQVNNSLESLKDVLVKKGLAKRLSSPEEKGGLWIVGKSQEKRQFPRLDLSRDYNRTIILRIEPQDKSKSIKSFADNISVEGLCFETRKEFMENEIINLRLFFFGDKVPMMRIQATVMWKKTVPPFNYCGVHFDLIAEEDELELIRYVNSKLDKTTVS